MFAPHFSTPAPSSRRPGVRCQAPRQNRRSHPAGNHPITFAAASAIRGAVGTGRLTLLGRALALAFGLGWAAFESLLSHIEYPPRFCGGNAGVVTPAALRLLSRREQRGTA